MEMASTYVDDLKYIADLYTILLADHTARQAGNTPAHKAVDLAVSMDGLAIVGARLKARFEGMILTKAEQSVYTILSDKQWYSYSTAATKTQCDIKSDADLRSVCTSLATKLKDPINFFMYNEVEYIGFETRRLDYDRDKLAGTNPIEKLIALGVYDRKR